MDGSCVSLFTGCDSPSDFAFTDLTSVVAAAEALLDQVFLDTPGLGLFDSNPALTQGCIDSEFCVALIPFDSTFSFVFQSVNFNSILNDQLGIFTFPATTNTSIGETITYAVFSLTQTATVPEPATLFLFAVGLAFLAAFGRQRHQG